MKTDIFFRACTRPALFFGVPVIPSLIGAGFSIALTFYVNLWFVICVPIVHMYLQYLTKKDEQIFENLMLVLKTKATTFRNSTLKDTSVILPHATISSKIRM